MFFEQKAFRLGLRFQIQGTPRKKRHQFFSQLQYAESKQGINVCCIDWRQLFLLSISVLHEPLKRFGSRVDKPVLQENRTLETGVLWAKSVQARPEVSNTVYTFLSCSMRSQNKVLTCVTSIGAIALPTNITPLFQCKHRKRELLKTCRHTSTSVREVLQHTVNK